MPGRIDQRELGKAKAKNKQTKTPPNKNTNSTQKPRKKRCESAHEDEGASYEGEEPATGLLCEQALASDHVII